MQLSSLRHAINAIRSQVSPEVWELLSLQQTILEDQEARIKELEARLKQTSQNSHLPPSSDGLRKANAQESESPEEAGSEEDSAQDDGDASLGAAPKRKRKSGGQFGHKGSTLQAVATPTHHAAHHLPAQCGCGASLTDAPRHWVSRQVFDLPPMAIEVTEHQIEHCQCGRCGTMVAADAPPWVTQAVQYGPNLRALVVDLHVHQLIPFARIKEMLADWLGVNLSEGSIRNWLHMGDDRLESFVEGVKAQIMQAPVCCTDETSVRIEGKTQWLHTLSTREHVWQIVHPKRGKQAHEEMGILAHYQGTLVHDAYAPYRDYLCTHGLCNAHLARELQNRIDFEEAIWAQQWLDELLRLKALVDEAKARGQDSLAPPVLASARGRLEMITAIGLRQHPEKQRKPGQRGRVAQGKSRNLLLRLHHHLSDYLRFTYDFDVPFDNNQAERDLRMAKVKQKVSGCHRSRGTAQAFARIRSYLLTAKRQGIHAAQALADLFAWQKIPLQIV